MEAALVASRANFMAIANSSPEDTTAQLAPRSFCKQCMSLRAFRNRTTSIVAVCILLTMM
jgi:hypothetical protein